MVLVTWYRAIKLHCWNPGHGLSFHAYIFLLIWLQMFSKFNFEEATNKLLIKTGGDWYTRLRMMTQIILQWQIHLALNIQHHVVLLPTTCVLVGAESWQRGAAKNERQGTIYMMRRSKNISAWWLMTTLYLNVGTDEKWSCRKPPNLLKIVHTF